MKRFVIAILTVSVILGGSWAIYHKDQLEGPSDLWRLASQQMSQVGVRISDHAAGGRASESIRIASMNLDSYGSAKAQQSEVVAMLARMLSRFDVIALQNIQGGDQHVLSSLIDALNSDNRREFQVMMSPPLGRAANLRRYAILYNAARIEPGPVPPYVIDDPDDVFRRPPFVSWFRTRSRDPQRSFTFSVVNVHLDADTVGQEIAHLHDVFRAVRSDGRNEDDIILCGTFYVAPGQLRQLRQTSGLLWAIGDLASDLQRGHAVDNIVFDPIATSEFSGQSGVVDFLKEFNLTLEEAARISRHLPVWAEFAAGEDWGLAQRAR